jgi:hypothetical protein
MGHTLETRLAEELAKTMSNQTSDIVAVKLVVLDRDNLPGQELSHAVAHALADVRNDGLVPIR